MHSVIASSIHVMFQRAADLYSVAGGRCVFDTATATGIINLKIFSRITLSLILFFSILLLKVAEIWGGGGQLALYSRIVSNCQV